MKTKNKKNSIIKRILAFGGALLCAFAFCFGLVNIRNNKETLQVSADTSVSSYRFSSSEIILPTSYFEYYYHPSGNYLCSALSYYNSYNENYLNYSSYFKYNFVSFEFELYYDNNGNVRFIPFIYPLDIVPSHDIGYYVDPADDGFIQRNGLYCCSILNDDFSDYDYLTMAEINENGIPLDGYYSDNKSNIANGKRLLFSLYQSPLNATSEATGVFDYAGKNVGGIVFSYYYSSLNFKIENINRLVVKGSNLYYYDTDNNYIRFEFLYKNDYFNLPERTYFLTPNFTDNDYYNQGYSAGQSSGYNEGFMKGEDMGYSSGYNTGKNDGYWDGYNQALENDNRYSFTSLITSVIDVPVKAFTSLFNFEILGVNLSGFFTGLFTFSVAIFILKLII